MVGTITQKTKREGQKEAKRCVDYKNQRRERSNPFHGRKLSHP
jgi:hypothetical protein